MFQNVGHLPESLSELSPITNWVSFHGTRNDRSPTNRGTCS